MKPKSKPPARSRVTKAQACRIAARYDAKARWADATVTSGEGAGLYLRSPLRPSDVWLVHLRGPEDSGRLGAGLVAAVSKMSGEVVFRGMLGE